MASRILPRDFDAYQQKAVRRFWSKVDKNGPMPVDASLGNCWMWTACSSGPAHDYGRFSMFRDGRNVSMTATRFAYELEYGEFDKTKLLCHRCDNTRCVRPSHLFPGTQKDNIQDALKKKRMTGPRGSVNGQAKLTEFDVMCIRTAYRIGGVNVRNLAFVFGVSVSGVYGITIGTNWKHLPVMSA
jgi:hypothetical protein